MSIGEELPAEIERSTREELLEQLTRLYAVLVRIEFESDCAYARRLAREARQPKAASDY